MSAARTRRLGTLAWLLAPLVLCSMGCTKPSASTPAAAATRPSEAPGMPAQSGDAPASTPSASEAATMTTTDGSPEDRYRAWLGSEKGMADAEVAAWRPGSTGDWHFFFVKGPPGLKLHPAAVGPAAILTPGSGEADWKALLTANPAAEVHKQIAWLNGMWMAVVPDTPHAQSVARKHPAITDHLTAPSVQLDGDAAVFSGWYAEPPAMVSFHLTVRAGPDGATFERKKLVDF